MQKMQNVCRNAGAATVVLLAVLGFVGASGASAQEKKLTYEQAWATCKAEVAKNVSPNEGRDTAARYAAGGACMKRHGYRLKKSTKM